MSKQVQSSRDRINAYTSAIIITLATFTFMFQVKFLPGSPFFPLFIAVILGFSAIYKNPRWASTGLSLIVFLSIAWQLIGYEIYRINSSIGLISLAVIFVLLISNLLSARQEPTSMALAVMAVAIMLTPQYYLSVAFIVAAAAIGGISSVGAISITYISTLLPFLVIENGLISGIQSPGIIAPPLIFSSLTSFAQDMRPPLTGLNLIITGAPQGFFSPNSDLVINYLSGTRIVALVVPILILGIVFSLSSAVAGIINSMLEKLSVFERMSQLVKMLSPLAASLGTPLTFVILIVNLSPTNIGGYETSLTKQTSDQVNLIMASIMLGLVFTSREYLIQWFERVEKARISIRTLLEQTYSLLDLGKQYLGRTIKDAPTINASSEERALTECESFMEDVKKGLDTASYDSLTFWREELSANTAQRVRQVPEVLRTKIVGELNLLNSLSVTYNSTLNETGAPKMLPEAPTLRADMSFDKALMTYARLIIDIWDTVNVLFTDYVSTNNAYNILMDQTELSPPVNPASLFESYDFPAGIKLIAEEYWLNFHVKNSAELESRTQSLRNAVDKFELQAGEAWKPRARQISDRLQTVKPGDSNALLEDIQSLKALNIEILDAVAAEINQLERLIRTLIPGSTKVVSFQVMQQSGKLEVLRRVLADVNPSLLKITRVVGDVVAFLNDYEAYKKADERNLIIISQYTIAKNVIAENLKRSRKIKLSDLPFQRDAAIMYSRFFSFDNPSVRFDDDEEVIEPVA